MRVNLDTIAIETAIQQIKAIAAGLTSKRFIGVNGSLAGFSPANGFRTSGRTLGHISDQSAPEATDAVSSFALGIANTLEAALRNAMWADSSLSGLLAGLGETFGSRASMATGNITALVQQLHSTNPETTRFATPPASAGLELSLEALANSLQQTRAAEAMNASSFWTSNASLLQRAVNDLNSVKHALQSSAETPWVEQGMQAITQLQNAGAEYAANSTALAQHTAHLGQLAMQEQVLAMSAVQAMRAIPEPDLRIAFEQTYLQTYVPRVDAGLITTVPMFNRLLPDLQSLPGGSLQIPNPPLPQTPTFDGSSLPKVVQDALSANGYGDLVQAKSPKEVVQRFGNVNPDAMNSIAAGATPTQAAATAAPSMPPSLAPGGGAPVGGPGAGGAGAYSPATLGGVGMGGPGAGQAAAARSGAPLGGGALGAPIGGTTPGSGSSANGGRGSTGAFGAGRGFAGQGAGMGMGPGAGRAGFGTTGGFGAGGFGAGAPGSAGGLGAGANGGHGAAGAAGSPGSGANGGAHAAAMNGGRGTAVAAGPMGAAGANQNRRDGSKPTKVKTVTSAVERDGNLKALLGDAPLVLPEVIGHNVKG